MNEKGAFNLAVATIHHAVFPFNSTIPKTVRRSYGLHTYTPKERKHLAQQKLKDLEREYKRRVRFLTEGKIFRMVCDVIDREPNKFFNQIMTKLEKDYLKAEVELFFLIDICEGT